MNYLESVEILTNVLKSCIGGGIYLYPELFRYYGYKLAIMATILSSIASLIGVFIYLDVNNYYKKGNTITTLANQIISNFGYLTDFVVILKSITVAAGYLDLSKRILNNLILDTRFEILNTKSEKRSSILVILLSIIMSPGVLANNISILKKLSYIGTLSILLIICLSMVSSVKEIENSKIVNENFNFFQKIGSFVFGFVCHTNVLVIHNDYDVSLLNMKLISFAAFVFVGIWYITFGWINYYKNINASDLKDLFALWNPGILTNTAILLFTFVLVTSVPNQLHPAKSYLMRSFNLNQKQGKMVGLGMILLCYFLTYTGDLFEKIVRYVTTPLNTLLCFIFPAIFLIYSKPKLSIYQILMVTYLFIFSIICILSIIYR